MTKLDITMEVLVYVSALLLICAGTLAPPDLDDSYMQDRLVKNFGCKFGESRLHVKNGPNCPCGDYAVNCHKKDTYKQDIEQRKPPFWGRDGKLVKLELKSWPVDVKIPCENMSPQLRSTLDQGIFPTTKQRRQLIQVLYDYMLQFGRYPSRFHYEQVAQQLIKEYPCLAQNNIPSAKPYDYWKLKISDKFRNERKSMGNLVDEERRRKVRKVSHQPELEGEDHGSIMMHIKWMQDESTKKTPDWKKVKALMEITFHERRGDITNKMMVQDIKEKYPFLFSITEIHNEFERINGVAGVTTITKNLRPFVEGILHFPYKDKHAENFIKTTFANKLTEAVTMEKAEEIKIIAALSLLPSLFKKNPSSIMGTKDEHSNENLAPFLLVSSKNIFEADGFVVNCEQVELQMHTSNKTKSVLKMGQKSKGRMQFYYCQPCSMCGKHLSVLAKCSLYNDTQCGSTCEPPYQITNAGCFMRSSNISNVNDATYTTESNEQIRKDNTTHPPPNTIPKEPICFSPESFNIFTVAMVAAVLLVGVVLVCILFRCFKQKRSKPTPV